MILCRSLLATIRFRRSLDALYLVKLSKVLWAKHIKQNLKNKSKLIAISRLSLYVFELVGEGSGYN